MRRRRDEKLELRNIPSSYDIKMRLNHLNALKESIICGGHQPQHYGRLGYQDNFKPVYFFSKNFWACRNANHAKTKQQNKIKETLNKKGNICHAHKNF